MNKLRRFFVACGTAAFGLFGLVPLAAPIAWSTPPEGAELLWRQAESKKLADHPYWLRLLHYPSQSPLVSEWRSEIGTPSFFLHPDGTTDPAAELRETLAALLSLIHPKANKGLFIALSVVAYPIGFVLSYVIMGTLFFAVITPTGLVMRALGKDPLEKRFTANAPTYWSQCRSKRPSASYFQQF